MSLTHCTYCGSTAHPTTHCPKSYAGSVLRLHLRCTYCGSKTHNYEGCPKTQVRLPGAVTLEGPMIKTHSVIIRLRPLLPNLVIHAMTLMSRPLHFPKTWGAWRTRQYRWHRLNRDTPRVFTLRLWVYHRDGWARSIDMTLDWRFSVHPFISGFVLGELIVIAFLFWRMAHGPCYAYWFSAALLSGHCP